MMMANDNEGERWVTINGNPVLIKDAGGNGIKNAAGNYQGGVTAKEMKKPEIKDFDLDSWKAGGPLDDLGIKHFEHESWDPFSKPQHVPDTVLKQPLPQTSSLCTGSSTRTCWTTYSILKYF